jgi:hypothetical protein
MEFLMSLKIILGSPVGILAFISSINVGTAMAESSFRYCVPGTRCVEYSACFINNVQQPCAYGSGGAIYGGIIFDHGYFSVEWLGDQTAKVTYGNNQEFKANAVISVENGFRVFRLDDGTTVRYPASGGRRNPRDGAAPTHRPMVN